MTKHSEFGTSTPGPLGIAASGDPSFGFYVFPIDSDGIELPPIAAFAKHADALRFVYPEKVLTWHPVTDTPPHGWHLVAIGGEVHEAWYFFDDTASPLLIRGWRLADDATHRRMLRTGATITAWAGMPKAP